MEPAVRAPLEKQPTERINYALDLAPWLPEGAVISSVVGSVLDITDGTAYNALLAATSIPFTTLVATGTLTGGTDGHDYQVTYTITLNDSQVQLVDYLVQVRKVTIGY